MTALAFDTLKFVQTLSDKAKFTQEQSEGLANAIADATSDQIATKGDLTRVEGDLRTYIQSVDASVQRLEISLKSELKTVESRLETKIELLRSDVLKWIVGSIGFQTLVILGAVITLTRVIGHP